MSELIEKTKNYVVNLLDKKLSPKYLYHNLRHTQRVVKSTKELGEFYNLDKEKQENLTLAAWFHDVGYTKDFTNHEENGCILAKKFFADKGCNKTKIAKICSYIMATKRQYKPVNLSEEIIRDADASHFAQGSYLETAKYLKEELEQLNIAAYTPKEWCNENIKMFKSEHTYYTDYAKKNWKPLILMRMLL